MKNKKPSIVLKQLQMVKGASRQVHSMGTAAFEHIFEKLTLRNLQGRFSVLCAALPKLSFIA